MRKAQVTISRPSYSSDKKAIVISIDDFDSGIRVMDLEMTLEDFAECLTGLANCSAVVEHWCGKRAKDLGKIVEPKTVHLSGQPPYDKDEAAKWVRAHPELSILLKEGWIISSDGTRSQQPSPTHHTVHLVRFVARGDQP